MNFIANKLEAKASEYRPTHHQNLSGKRKAARVGIVIKLEIFEKILVIQVPLHEL